MRRRGHRTKVGRLPAVKSQPPARIAAARTQPVGHNDVEDSMRRSLAGLAALSFSLITALPASAQTVGTGGPGTVTAIDIVLEPDATMVKPTQGIP